MNDSSGADAEAGPLTAQHAERLRIDSGTTAARDHACPDCSAGAPARKADLPLHRERSARTDAQTCAEIGQRDA